MFFGCMTTNKNKRKEKLSPERFILADDIPPITSLVTISQNTPCRKRRSFFAPQRGSLTVEAAVVLPIFFLCMIVMLHFCKVIETATRFGSALAETSEKMAVDAYAYENGGGGNLAVSVLSAGYARGQIMSKTGNTSAVKNTNFLLSSFLSDEERIDLVLTYQVKAPVGGVKIPWVFFLQRGCVRAWTGRSGSDGNTGNTGDDDKNSDKKVYVTETGSVYHSDTNCTYLRLSIHQVGKDALSSLRNNSGEKYHACEICGKNAGGSVYITNDGNRYHTSLECSGLKRTVHEMTLDEVGNMRPCSKCGGAH